MTAPKFNFPDPPVDLEEGGKCVFCGSGDLIAGVKVLDHWHEFEEGLRVGKDANPEALVFKGRKRSCTLAMVCGSCGFVHLFATNPKVLKRVGG